MYLQKIKENLAIKCRVLTSDFVYPPQIEMGDLSLPTFSLSKKSNNSPVEIASKLLKDLQSDEKLFKLFEKIEVKGPYLNFFLAKDLLANESLADIKTNGVDFGKNDFGDNKKIMFEYSNANTHKEYHVGHLRNLFFGNALTRLFSRSNYEVVSASYINDFGIHVAKAIWGWQHCDAKEKLQAELKTGAPKGYLLGTCYSLASQEVLKDENKKAAVTEIMREIESRQGKQYELWRETRAWSIDYFDKIYQELDINFQHIFYESDFIEEGIGIVEEFLEKGIFRKSEGAIIADLEKFNLGVLPIIRSDQTALYPVADLALARRKFKDYQINESVYVVDVRQGLYFKQLEKIFELSGENLKISHLGYDFVTLKSGMMSSRSGNIITYRELIEEAIKRAIDEIKSRHGEWADDKINKIANSLAKAALRFEMLKVSSDKVIVFDLDEALRFDGYTAAYLQYSGARLASILRKAEDKAKIINNSLLIEDKEKNIILHLQKFPEIILQATSKRDPSLVARYLFELAQLFNDYYHSVPILKAEKELSFARLSLLEAVQQILENGFDILGIQYLEEM